MKKYRIWNTKVDEYKTLEEAEKEAKKRARRNKYGCDIYAYNPASGGWTVIKTIKKDNE